MGQNKWGQTPLSPLGHGTQLTYTLAGGLVEPRDPLGNVSRMEADGAVRTTTPKGYGRQSFTGASAASR